MAKDNPHQAEQIRQMLKPKRSLFELSSFVIGFIVITWLPIAALLFLGINIIFWLVFPPKKSDRLL
ncbi:hypothetical protein [uncultured Limosilactobacillus sp.]|uniref:hypothetical protein n=1 Tax=uncultured Limosilactobacillus sp. TaxID=2837629 RepID=UPI0025F6C09A|nr:hypothetical protein [uncultured Limosilactobacillus sp.]